VEEDPVKKPTYEMLASAAKYAQTQNDYKNLNDRLRKTEEELQIAYNQLRK
jgi:uncharacterized protein YukE